MIDLCWEGEQKIKRQHDLDTRRLEEICAFSRPLPGTNLKLMVEKKLEHGALIPATRPVQLVIFWHFWVMSVKRSLLLCDFFNNNLPLEAFFVEAICVMVNRKRTGNAS